MLLELVLLAHLSSDVCRLMEAFKPAFQNGTMETVSSEYGDRDAEWIITVRSPQGAQMAVHFSVLPKSQWKPEHTTDNPPLLLPPISRWFDLNGDGFYEHLTLDPLAHNRCEEMVHMIWNGARQVYELVVGGKDHI